jgi:hypothetical protein
MPPDTDAPRYFYPNRMGRVILTAMETAMGREQLEAVLAAAGLEQLRKLPPNNLEKKFPFEWVSALQEAVEKVYGERPGRALNLRVGRLCFNSGLKEFEPILGIADLPMRLMPLSMKFRVGLEVFSRVFNQFSDQLVRLGDNPDEYLWIIERNPVCWNRQTSEPCCHLALGILEESIFWGTGGRRYKVEESECIAAGAATCVFRIDKKPLD